jgi:hypothetical protein
MGAKADAHPIDVKASRARLDELRTESGRVFGAGRYEEVKRGADCLDRAHAAIEARDNAEADREARLSPQWGTVESIKKDPSYQRLHAQNCAAVSDYDAKRSQMAKVQMDETWTKLVEIFDRARLPLQDANKWGLTCAAHHL